MILLKAFSYSLCLIFFGLTWWLVALIVSDMQHMSHAKTCGKHYVQNLTKDAVK